MKDNDCEIVDSIAPDDRAWLEWKSLVEDEGWTSDDLSVLTLTPTLPSTRIVLARKKSDGSFIGTVIWNEYDEIAFIGFYLLKPEYRGKGIGSLAPLYASSADEAFAVIRPLIKEIENLHADARFLFHVLDGSVGATVLPPIFSLVNVSSKLAGITLFSKEYHNPIDNERVFIAHNNSGHYDS
ncbi:hypothetical protein TELCIR_16449 [Teladorsagia circumcincta]|uniref:N-acetyltransferase domain-containing protein n=1 Tax=Teladorsagia circumcincta TaxID=45464 RepID=A0A2G9TX37_TELCI|nr:hypothetical protein TELCIR_16449 [Teladorsagia circumcincta]